MEVCLCVTPMERFGAIPRGSSRRVDTAQKLGRIRSAAVTTGETLRLAIDSLRAHKLRSFLTLLGVIMAVTPLGTVMSAIARRYPYVDDRVGHLGGDVFPGRRFGVV